MDKLITYENTQELIEKFDPVNSERQFMENCQEILGENCPSPEDFFEFLKGLDKGLLDECYKELELSSILELLFSQRYVNAHDEDNKQEKFKEAALQDFISDKYDSGVHFFEEILQNIDDAIGRKKEDNNGKVIIKWIDNAISFTYPDRGFTFYDLMAITSLANSIKKGDIEHASIGEKGIGFKSVFSVAKKISIESRFFNFDIEYDENRKTSVLQPSQISLPGLGKQESQLIIFFNDKFKLEGNADFKNQLRNWLFENEKENYLNYSPFLFLKNVQHIEYTDNTETKTIEIERKKPNETEDLTENFSITTIGAAKYLLYKESLQFDKSLIENRWGKIAAIADKDENFTINRPVEIAFPVVDYSDEIKEKKGLFYSYLPTEMVIDAPIYINVDVHLKSSRGRISEADFTDGSEWNKHILERLPHILENAYQGVVNSYNDKTPKCNDSMKKVAENLYLYIKYQTTAHYFCEKLNDFYNNILKQNIYLDVTGQFVSKDEIELLKYDEKDEKDWNRFVAFCLNKPFPDSNNSSERINQYPRDFRWFCFTKNVRNVYQYNLKDWKEFCLKKYGGIDNFYKNTTISEQKDKMVVVLDVLEAIQSRSLSKNDKDAMKVLFLDGENGVEIYSKEEIDGNGKVVFFSTKELSEEDDISVYISRKPFEYGEENKEDENKHYQKYKEYLKGYIDEKDWKAFIENILRGIDAKENNPTKWFYDCCRYLAYVKSDDIKKILVPEDIKKVFSKYVICEAVCDSLEKKDYRLYSKAIAKYVSKHRDCGYDIFDPCFENQSEDGDMIAKKIDFLIELGIKCFPDKEFVKDELSINVLPNYSGTTTELNSLEFVYPGDDYYEFLDNADDVKTLQKYFVEKVNEQKQNEQKQYNKNISEIFKAKGLDFDKFVFINGDILTGFEMKIRLYGPKGGEKGIIWHRIGSFIDAANEEAKYYMGEKEPLKLNSGTIALVDQDKYSCFVAKRWLDDCKIEEREYEEETRYDKSHLDIIEIIVNGAPKPWLDKLRWTIIWNKVFGVKYAYPGIKELNMSEFISFYKSLCRSDIKSILPKGFSIHWENNDVLFTDECSYTLNDYIKNEFSIEQIDFSKYYGYSNGETAQKCISLESFRKDGILKDDGEHYYTHLVIIGTKTPKTDYIELILSEKEISISDVQRKEIADIVDEIPESAPKNIVGLNGGIHGEYTEAIFRDESHQAEYDDVIDTAISRLPSVFAKANEKAFKQDDWDMKRWLCEPYRFKQYVFQGYGYQCPICGATMHHHSISGLKFIRRIKNTDEVSKATIPYIYFVCCLNCADMIERATKVMIRDYDLQSLIDSLNHFEDTCYCSDMYHPFNHGLMKTMNLYLEIDGREFVEKIKISFLHMALLLREYRKYCKNE